MDNELERFREEIAKKDDEIKLLKSLLCEKRAASCPETSTSLSQAEIKRYSRQLIMPEIGVKGQIALKNASVLIVGAGGLGCPVGMYLAAAGVGKIGIVDHDVVDISNLHRQLAHTEKSIGEDKCVSFVRTIKLINSSTECCKHSLLLKSSNIQEIIEPYDVLVDASDNVPTRYLLNDAAVLFSKPLVSGSALRYEGQLTVYNFQDGPCYRCLFPKPPSPDATTNCSEGGVLGVITGIIGCFQALEVIKIIIDITPSYSKKMLVFDGLSGDLKVIKLRGKKSDCEVCGDNPSVIKLIDYEQFCNTSATDNDNNISLLPSNKRISCSEYKNLLDNGIEHLLIDVRPAHEVTICHLPGSVNMPLSEIIQGSGINKLKKLIEYKGCQDSFVICRRGNDSQKAVLLLQKLFENYTWRDIKGGLYAWQEEVDSTFPLY